MKNKISIYNKIKFLSYLKEQSKSRIHKKIALKILKEKINTDLLLTRYKEYDKYKLLMKRKKIVFEKYFEKANDKDDFINGIELFADEIQKIILNQKIKKYKSMISIKYKFLIDKRTDELFELAIIEKITPMELQKNFIRKIAKYKNVYDFNDALIEYLNIKINWSRSEIEEKIKKEKINAEIINEKDNSFIIKINDSYAAKRLGSQLWCITQDESIFNHYIKDFDTFYFMYDFEKETIDCKSLIALLVSPNGDIKKAFTKDDYIIRNEQISPVVANNMPKKTKEEIEDYINKKLNKIVKFEKFLYIEKQTFEFNILIRNICEELYKSEINEMSIIIDKSFDLYYKKEKNKQLSQKEISKEYLKNIYEEFYLRTFSQFESVNYKINKVFLENLLKNKNFVELCELNNFDSKKCLMDLLSNTKGNVKKNIIFLLDNKFITKKDILNKTDDNNINILYYAILNEDIKEYKNIAIKYEDSLLKIIKNDYENINNLKLINDVYKLIKKEKNKNSLVELIIKNINNYLYISLFEKDLGYDQDLLKKVSCGLLKSNEINITRIYNFKSKNKLFEYMINNVDILKKIDMNAFDLFKNPTEQNQIEIKMYKSLDESLDDIEKETIKIAAYIPKKIKKDLIKKLNISELFKTFKNKESLTKSDLMKIYFIAREIDEDKKELFINKFFNIEINNKTLKNIGLNKNIIELQEKMNKKKKKLKRRRNIKLKYE